MAAAPKSKSLPGL